MKSGDRHYRAWVGPPGEYDLISALQVSLLFATGLREYHNLCDVGCGSLRAGRIFMPYLRKGNYHGVQPEKWLVEEGIEKEIGKNMIDVKQPKFRFSSDFPLKEFDTEFDFVVAQSVFSHTLPRLLQLGLDEISGSLAPSGKLLATYNEAPEGKQGKPKLTANSTVFENGWVRKGGHTYTWEEMEVYLREAGLVGWRIKWPHPRQVWFLASKPQAGEETRELASKLRSPRPGWGEKQNRSR